MNASKHRRTLRTSVTVIAGSALLFGLGACGADKSGTGELKEESTMTVEQWRSDVDSCMLAAGFDITGGENGNESVDTSQFDMDAFDKEYTTCIKKIGDAPVDPNQLSADEMFDVQLAFAKCMRDSGYDYPDPVEGGMVGSFGPEINPDDVDACTAKANETGPEK
ncbi:hypothetical protein GCM10009688_18720 [Arthrobacter gandavensis]|uniref:Lipoprotein n=1 Tax=Arthrobacter gandavensis TaxID=169960 RepID=A0ABN2PAP3_9MICC|nr:hypothetical protein [Arthrobacter citreus]